MAHNRLWRRAPHPLDQDADRVEKEPGELPYKLLYHHQYWFTDICYLVRFEGKWVYSICIIEGLYRTLFASPQIELFKLDDDQWLKILQWPEYAKRRVTKSDGARQLSLAFSYLLWLILLGLLG